jgi:hypothetical protein
VSPVRYELGFISKKTAFFIVTAVETSSLCKSDCHLPQPSKGNDNAFILYLRLKTRLTTVGTRWADHATHLYPQKLALISPISVGRSVYIVRLRMKSHRVVIYLILLSCSA